jgi:hypothetical protein
LEFITSDTLFFIAGFFTNKGEVFNSQLIYLNGFDLLLWHFNLNKGIGELYPDKGKEQSLLVAITNFPAWRYRTSSEGETIHASISCRGLFSEFWGTLLLCLNHMLWGRCTRG